MYISVVWRHVAGVVSVVVVVVGAVVIVVAVVECRKPRISDHFGKQLHGF